MRLALIPEYSPYSECRAGHSKVRPQMPPLSDQQTKFHPVQAAIVEVPPVSLDAIAQHFNLPKPSHDEFKRGEKIAGNELIIRIADTGKVEVVPIGPDGRPLTHGSPRHAQRMTGCMISYYSD